MEMALFKLAYKGGRVLARAICKVTILERTRAQTDQSSRQSIMGLRPANAVVDWLLSLSLISLAIILYPTAAKQLQGRPCTAGYGVLDATDDIVDLDDNEGCNFLKGEVPFTHDTCVKLLEQGPCQQGEWLIIDDDTDMMKCKQRECEEGRVLYEDQCTSLDDKTICKPTFELIINEHGEGECQCPPGYLFYPSTNRCYVPFTRGPCRSQHIIKMKIEDNSSIGECEINPCPREKMTPLDNHCLPQDDTSNARCYTIGKQNPCKGGSYLLIEPSLARPFCLAQKPNSIVPRIVKRATPCQMSYTRSCVRQCDGPNSFPFRGYCPRNYSYFINYGAPICLRGRCRRISF